MIFDISELPESKYAFSRKCVCVCVCGWVWVWVWVYVYVCVCVFGSDEELL